MHWGQERDCIRYKHELLILSAVKSASQLNLTYNIQPHRYLHWKIIIYFPLPPPSSSSGHTYHLLILFTKIIMYTSFNFNMLLLKFLNYWIHCKLKMFCIYKCMLLSTILSYVVCPPGALILWKCSYRN